MLSIIGRRLLDFVLLLFAGLLYALALKYFVLPAKVILTGSEGIATALSYYFSSYRLFLLLYLCFHLLLLGFAIFKVSTSFALHSLLVVVTVVVLLLYLPELSFASPEPQHERMLLVIFGGLLTGAAKAIAFKRRGSTGDEDVLAAYFAMKYMKPVGSIAVVAAVVSTAFGLLLVYLKAGGFESVINTLMYTCIYIFVSAETLNTLYHKFKLTLLTIITSQRDAVGAAITGSHNHRTYTVHEGRGGRSGDTFCMVRTIITREELPKMIESVQAADPVCFYYHHEIEGISPRYYIAPIA